MNKYFFRKLIFKFFCHLLTLNQKLRGSNSRIEYDLKFFGLISKFKNEFSFKVNNHKMVCGLSQSGLGWHIFLHQTFEEDALKICKAYIQPDSIILDIGANIGIQSVFYAQLAPEGRVYSFDPSRYSYEFLLKNTRSIPHIVPLNIGISNLTGFVDFFENEWFV